MLVYIYITKNAQICVDVAGRIVNSKYIFFLNIAIVFVYFRRKKNESPYNILNTFISYIFSYCCFNGRQ